MSRTSKVVLPLFSPAGNDNCTKCGLGGQAGLTTVCVRSRWWKKPRPGKNRRKCLYLIGEAPARFEDKLGKPFVGASGQILDAWLTACNLGDHVDVVLGNTVRCRLPKDAKPSKSEMSACWEYTLDELRQLRKTYVDPDQLALVCLGGYATQIVLGLSSVDKALEFQGSVRAFGVGIGNVPVFVTYHPAFTLPGRNPAATHAVKDHLSVICRWLRDGRVHSEEKPWAQPCYSFPVEQLTGATRLSVDVETYGILQGCDQTVFHPTRSMLCDGIPKSDLIVTGQLGTDSIWTTHRWGRATERAEFIERLRQAVERGLPLLFMNAQFDLQYLRKAGLNFLDHRTLVEDVSVWNYLETDVRPERSLKKLGTLFGLAKYEDRVEAGGFVQYKSPDDPKLATYGQKDVHDTIVIRDMIVDRIGRSYPTTQKLSKYTRKWYSDLTWLGVYMSEAGVPINVAGLRKFQGKVWARRQNIVREAAEKFGLTLCGKGSQNSIQELIDSAVVATGIEDHPDLENTEKSGKTSTGEANIELILNHLDVDQPGYDELVLLQQFRSSSKLLDTYLRPLIGDPSKGWPTMKGGRVDLRSCVLDGIVYPTWRVVPVSGRETGTSGRGGTTQGRITCVFPPIQTYSDELQEFITTRHNRGYILSVDLSQIELRVAAFDSADPKMLLEYEQGQDRHWIRALDIFPEGCSKHGKTLEKECSECKQKRQIGKTVNFLLIYRGGPERLRLTCRQDIGYHMDRASAKRIVQALPKMYPAFWKSQDELIANVTKIGYIVDPVLGQGRVFSKSAYTNMLDYENNIVNFKPQNIGANLMLGIQMPLAFELVEKGLASRMILNIYDAMYIEGPASEEQQVTEMVRTAMPQSEYMTRLEEAYGRKFPLAYEGKIIRIRKSKYGEHRETQKIDF